MTDHRCTYDSHYGYIPGHAHLALMCGACGSWGMPGGGEWHTVPTELLPSACTHLSRKRKAAYWLKFYAASFLVGLAIGAIIAI
jgi:hypothetical protein